MSSKPDRKWLLADVNTFIYTTSWIMMELFLPVINQNKSRGIFPCVFFCIPQWVITKRNPLLFLKNSPPFFCCCWSSEPFARMSSSLVFNVVFLLASENVISVIILVIIVSYTAGLQVAGFHSDNTIISFRTSSHFRIFTVFTFQGCLLHRHKVADKLHPIIFIQVHIVIYLFISLSASSILS